MKKKRKLKIQQNKRFAGGTSPSLTTYLVMVGGDEPQLQVQVVVPLLYADKVEDVFVLHAAHAVDLILVLPGQLVLHKSSETDTDVVCLLSSSLINKTNLARRSQK